LDYSTIKGTFYDSNKYKNLTKLGSPNVSCDFKSVNPELKRKRGRPSVPSKPLTELSETQSRERTNNIYNLLLKECSEQMVSFDKLLAKLGQRFCFTVGDNYNHNKATMFKKVTIVVFVGKYWNYYLRIPAMLVLTSPF